MASIQMYLSISCQILHSQSGLYCLICVELNMLQSNHFCHVSCEIGE